jgi:mannosylglycerate hydrolase
MDKKVFHVISNTHWDREWRFPFQRNRQMLVDMIDEVISVLEKDPSYRAFHLDSQSIVVRDYLEAKPFMKERFINLVKTDRLLIGPWYILPDEFLVGGENLIRNLLLGHKISSAHGGVSKVGYSPFSWGQISQLPQLYKEFGIDLIMFYRGVNSLDSPKAEFLWEGADGTTSVTSRFSTMPRYNFYFYIYRPVIHNEGFYDVEYKWSKGGTPFHFADGLQHDEDFFIIQPLDTYYPELIETQVNAIIKDQAGDFTTKNVIWMEGHDSSGSNHKTVRILQDIKKMMPHLDVVHSTLSEYAKAVLESIDRDKLKIVTGERRSAQFDRRSGNLYGYTTSARMFLKQKNFDAERWLQFYAEPFTMFSGMLGRDINDQYISIAWELLLQNSAHDSIGGCSLDEIHEDMMHRSKQSIEISKGIFERSVKHIVKNIDMSNITRDESVNNELFLVAINPNNYLREEIIEAIIDIPKEFDSGSFDVIDNNGNKVIIQHKENFDYQPVIEQMIDRPMYFDMRRYRSLLQLKNIPPFGITTLKIVPTKISIKKNISTIGTIKNRLPILENDALKIKIHSNGTFTVQDKNNKSIFKEIGYFLDEGEGGHAWVHEKVLPFIDTLKSKPTISIVENGPISATCRIQHKLKLPINLKERKAKSKKYGVVNIDLFVTLTKNAQRVDLKININNTVESHRLRIMFPTSLDAKYSYGEGQFDVVKRTLDRPNTKDWIEQPMYDFPMHQFVDITDGKCGAAVLVNGLKEYEVLNDKKKTLAITLFRGFEFIIAPSSRQDYTYQKGSQCLGEQTFELSFFTHKYDWDKGNVYREALNYNNPLRLVQTGRTNGNLPSTTSFIQIEPELLVFSALKKNELNEPNTYVLRIYNPTENRVSGNIRTLFAMEKATLLTLEEKFISEIDVRAHHIFAIDVEPKKIKTIQITFHQ